jgi:hypothetical protein
MKTIFAIILACFCEIIAKADNERIFIDAKINGKPVRFAFDTGTGIPFFLYSTTARKFNLKVTPPPPDYQSGPGGTTFGLTVLCNLDFGTTHSMTYLGVVEIPQYLEPPEDGALGWPAISNNIFSINCIADTLNFYTNLPNGSASWIKFPIQTISGDLTLELSNQGQRKIVALDTGSDDGVKLNPQKWRAWKAIHTNQPMTLEAYYTPNPGWVVTEESWADKISLGPLTLTDVPVMEADSADIALYSSPQTKFEATLGFVALKRLDIIIDGKHGVAYLRPKKTPALPCEHNRLGAVFVPHDLQSDDLIAHVIIGSPAYEAGIRDGDILLKENGRDLTKWRTDTSPPPKISPVRQPAGTKLKLTLKRGNKIFKTTAVLRNILPPDAPANSN